jgi:peroxiredoxin
MTRLGRRAAPFRLRDAEGREHTLDDYASEWLLLVLHRHLG